MMIVNDMQFRQTECEASSVWLGMAHLSS